MLQPGIQIIIVILTSFLLGLGVGIGWLVFFSHRNIREQQLEQELACQNSHYRQMREDAHELRIKLKVMTEKLSTTQAEKKQLLQLLKTTSGHQNFHRIRQQLETARLQIQVLTAKLHHREQQIFDLTDILHTLRKHLRLRSRQHAAPALPEMRILRLSDKKPGQNRQEDDLKQIEGIDERTAHQLNSMGITRFQQLAECSPQQQAGIQKLIGKQQILPLQQWVKSARVLYHEKYLSAEHSMSQAPGHSRSA